MTVTHSKWYFCCCSLMVLAMACAGPRQPSGSAGSESGAGGGATGSSSIHGAAGKGGQTAVEFDGGLGTVADTGTCGITVHPAERLTADVLIVLDRSLSMNDLVMPPTDLGGVLNCLIAGPCPSKWADMTGAINSSVAASAAEIDWGLRFFPNDTACGVTDGVAVQVAPNNAAPIKAAISATQPGGFTPTAAALASAGRYLTTLTDMSPHYVVLATDGQPNCAGGSSATGDDAAAIAAVSNLAAAGIPVFVIGVATQGSTADTTLSSMASAGGKPRNATPPYYPVAVGADLVAALKAISTQVVSCSFAIPPPPDPFNIAVDADGKRVPKDATNGWQYGPNMTSIVLNGTWCADLQNGTIKNVQTTFACAGVIIP